MRTLLLTLIALLSPIPVSGAELEVQMPQVFEALMDLQVIALHPENFRSEKNKPSLIKNIEILASFKHAIPKAMIDNEPGAAAIASIFSSYLQEIRKDLDENRHESARARVRATTGYCFACHSRLNARKGFEDYERRVEKLPITTLQKAEFFASTRQFEKAIPAYRKALAESPKGELAMIEYARALGHALSVTVRVKKDPKITYVLVDELSKRQDLPNFIKGYISEWRKDTLFWVRDKFVPSSASGDAKVKKARSLMQRASGLQSFAFDERGDVSFLRAVTLLHEALEASPKAKYRGEILYLLGVCYAALQDPFYWDIDRLYFEACVREFPRTEVAKKCYRRYSDRLYFGFTGSRGTYVPEDELLKLMELRALAE